MKKSFHEDALESFRNHYAKEFNDFPQLEHLFESMFNYGYSFGLDYMLEGLNKNKNV